ncbi:TfpX/TfpZ family type IV pilin accessory protein [Fulvimonas sp. R45]|uniref:TfpX/TfpZ family type IV pilin accessory protein n=1 Tax=Fulvimonas sp. R45 TaxID=3045937 RepID=UPI00265E1F49|nr:TfpX/TfpZ family type IV pilin accessory protein [Fulvimonas sp. R45]MDO1527793.1 TfpX/TfpZ family type IV pilin accessory protein [Fulvimonas sp. R45]
MPHKRMSRWKAASIHLCISATIALCVGALLFTLWYPPPYFEAAGASVLMLLLIGVDLVLGPMLTLIVFRAGKKGMSFDLAVIGLVQATALVYGLHVITVARPVFIVACVDRFNLVTAEDLDPKDLAQGRAPAFRTLSWTGPRVVGAPVPTDPAERNEVIKSGLDGKDIQLLPKYYVDYTSVVPALLKHARPLAELRRINPHAGPVLDRWLARHTARTDTNTVWLPLMARKTSLTMLVDGTNGKILGALPIDPW